MRQDKKEADFVMASGQLLKEEVRYIETAFNRKRTGKKAEESNLLKGGEERIVKIVWPAGSAEGKRRGSCGSPVTGNKEKEVGGQETAQQTEGGDNETRRKVSICSSGKYSSTI